MKHIFASLLDVAKVAIAVVVLGLGASTLSAQSTWIPAPANPPANNAPAPINVSDLPQRKFGPLLLGTTAFPSPSYTSLDVLGIASTTSFFSDFLVVSKGVTFAAGSPMKRLLFNASGLSLIDGTQGAGKVLTSNASGLASWQALPTPTAGTRIIAGTGISVSPSSGVGDVTVSTTGSGLQIIGPLTDPSGTTAAHQASFTLSAASEVIVTAYAQLSSDAGGPGYVKLLVDGALIRTNYYGEECGRYCGGGTASVVLSGRKNLAAGNHTVRIESPGSRPSFYTTPEGGGVQVYVYVLNGGGGSSTNNNGSTAVTSGGGSASPMISGWPDAILCQDSGNGPYTIYYHEERGKQANTWVAYRTFGGSYFSFDKTTRQQVFAYGSAFGSASCSGKGIDQIPGFNFGASPSSTAVSSGTNLDDVRSALTYTSTCSAGETRGLTNASCTASCPTSKKVVSGSCVAKTAAGTQGWAPYPINTSAPASDGSGWSCNGVSPAGNVAVQVVGSAICL